MKSEFEIKAEQLVTAGQAPDPDAAFAILAAGDPSSYSQYLSTLKGAPKTIVAAQIAGPIGDTSFEIQARALVSAGGCDTYDEALAEIARDCPDSYARYLKELPR